VLLFYDTVFSIVPHRAEYRPSSGIVRLCDRIEDAFIPLTPTEEDLELDRDHYRALLGVLQELSGWARLTRARTRASHADTQYERRLRVGGFEIHSAN
jgi:hypothetical protein